MTFRVRAFGVHLLISTIVALLCLVLVFYCWYPAPLDKATGVTKIFLILLVCDMILGPVLTLIVANPRKKSLKIDLAIIGLVQFAALLYGLWTVENGRPVWLVFSTDRFDLVQSYELDNPYREKADAQFQSKNWFGPRWVAARAPEGIEEQNNLTFEALVAGIDIPQRPDLYIELEVELEKIAEKSKPIVELHKYNPADAVARAIKKYPQANTFLPMMSRAHPVTVLINEEQRKIIAVVDLVPWE
ncbi:MAG: TfpX/TfpZ family type IV pilin accessory protein [Pseudomonadota bacterium]|nr:TfpX/TfpZ family type IV pilin accessory protein [Pseudomonadota bacterium]